MDTQWYRDRDCAGTQLGIQLLTLSNTNSRTNKESPGPRPTARWNSGSGTIDQLKTPLVTLKAGHSVTAIATQAATATSTSTSSTLEVLYKPSTSSIQSRLHFPARLAQAPQPPVGIPTPGYPGTRVHWQFYPQTVTVALAAAAAAAGNLRIKATY
eukprot:2272067-Rhodomonas_salina.1